MPWTVGAFAMSEAAKCSWLPQAKCPTPSTRLARGTGALEPGHRDLSEPLPWDGFAVRRPPPVPDRVVQQSALDGPENQTLHRLHPRLVLDAVDGVANGDWLGTTTSITTTSGDTSAATRAAPSSPSGRPREEPAHSVASLEQEHFETAPPEGVGGGQPTYSECLRERVSINTTSRPTAPCYSLSFRKSDRPSIVIVARPPVA